MNEAIAIKNREAAIQEDEEIEAEEQPESQVDWQSIWKPLGIIAGVFLAFFWLPIESSRFTGAVIESLALAKWYAQEHVLLCLVPAFFIAGAISVFVSQAAVMKYLGAGANKVMSYGVASVSGTILAVCSCTVLPLFAGIWKRGAGLGPGDCVSLFRTGHQCAGNCAHGPDPGSGDRPGKSSRGGGVQHRYRPDHAPAVS